MCLAHSHFVDGYNDIYHAPYEKSTHFLSTPILNSPKSFEKICFQSFTPNPAVNKKRLLKSFQNPKTWAEGVNGSNGSGITANLAKGLGGLHPTPLCQQDQDFKRIKCILPLIMVFIIRII